MNMLTRRSLAIPAALVVVAGIAGCSGSDNKADSGPKTPAPAATATNPAMVGLIGSGCSGYVARVPRGSGSIDGMSQDPMAVAASHNPQLTMLTAAISGKLNKRVRLTDTLNGAPFTVFAPVDEAFKKVPAQSMARMKTDAALLVRTLTYHVVAGQLDAAHVVGTQRSVEGGELKVTRANGTLKVNGVNVICGGVRTANATVYLIDSVLMPAK